MFNQLRADGIVVMTNCAETGKVLADCPIPVVLVDRKLDGFKENALIESDNYRGGFMAAEHLAKCGCKNIVCMKEPTGIPAGADDTKVIWMCVKNTISKNRVWTAL